MVDVPVLDKKPTARNIAQRLVQRDHSFKEIATLEVRGQLFTDWKSVRVEVRASQPHPIFQFETSEESPTPVQRLATQFLPGDSVRVYLGGVLAVTGYIEERHVAYDARQHAVKLMGVGAQRDLVTSTVPLEKLEGHDNQSWLQLSESISNHLGIPIIPIGEVSHKPFQKVGLQPGETIMNVIERYARMRNIVIGSNHEGGLLGIGPHNAIPLGELVEGHNILKANAVIRDQSLFGPVVAVGQNSGGSSGGGGAADNQQICRGQGTSTRPKHMVVPVEIADDQEGVCLRKDMEMVFTEGTEIEANITVQGWFKDNNNSDAIWRANETYVINSPSLILPAFTLGCSACVYEQSDAGTTTTLTMVDPIHLNLAGNIRMAVARRQEQKQVEERVRLFGPSGRTDIIGSR